MSRNIDLQNLLPFAIQGLFFSDRDPGDTESVLPTMIVQWDFVK